MQGTRGKGRKGLQGHERKGERDCMKRVQYAREREKEVAGGTREREKGVEETMTERDI